MLAISLPVERFRPSLPLLLVVGSVAAFLCGALGQNIGLLGGGAVALCATWREWQRYGERLASKHSADGQARKRSKRRTNAPRHSDNHAVACSPQRECRPQPRLAQSAADLVDQFIETGRYALLLDPQTAAHLTDRQRERVIDIVETSMSIVPEGQVLVGVSAERASWGGTSVKATSDGVKRVDGFYIDRFAVTNAEFQHFVDAGVYEDFSLWPEEALPALFEFVDQTGNAGPRYWIDGHHDPALATHPVVGISWYEASAYARWVGKRLLTDAEWTKAAAWPVETTPGRIMQRRYPWGDSFESRRANLWNSSSGGTVSVEQYQHGSTLGGVYQLIGNVWEWTSDEFTEGCDINGHESFRTLHGGAFNTYFENQATCHFRSGEMPLARRDNVGFRLALSINTLEPQEDLESLELLPVLVD